MNIIFLKRAIFVFSLFFLYQCCGADESIKNDEKNSNKFDYIKPLPRGTLEISFTVKEIIEKDDIIILKSIIDKVYKYGAGVKPLAEGTNYSIEIDQKLFDSNKNNFVIGKQIKCRITSSAQSMDPEKTNKLTVLRLLQERE